LVRKPLYFVRAELTLGIVICNDSNYPELAECIAVQNAAVPSPLSPHHFFR
jgi:predicted amidohydrolase